MKKHTHNQWQELYNNQKSQSEQDNIIVKPEEIISYIFIFDCLLNTILYVNSSYETITEFSVNDFDINFMIANIHPEDLEYFLKCEEKNLKFTNELLFAEHFKYTLSYSYRIKTKDDSYIRIKQECQALEVNNSGHLTKTLVTHTHIKDEYYATKDDRRIFDKSIGAYVDETNTYNLSKRELEVLNLIKQGKNSQQVAEELFLSKNTILTHRKNILNKTKSSSFIELIKKLSYNYY